MSLRILSYNIQEGGEDRIPLIETVIAREAPDLVALAEVNSPRNAEKLAHALAMQLTLGEARSGFHVAWLSRLPVRRSRNHDLPILAKTLLEIEVEWQGQPLRAFATHLASRWDSSTPLDEIQAILEILRPTRGAVILAGDFNALAPGERVGVPPPNVVPRPNTRDDDPRPVIRHVLDTGMIDCYRAIHPQPPGYTYQSDHPWLRIDFIFASPSLAVHLRDSGIVTEPPTNRASDHLPIWTEFK
jgi:endonuclease/exonuclease/phosphatase family metal-dependent hydrolase